MDDTVTVVVVIEMSPPCCESLTALCWDHKNIFSNGISSVSSLIDEVLYSKSELPGGSHSGSVGNKPD